jgi:hypothetical protein
MINRLTLALTAALLSLSSAEASTQGSPSLREPLQQLEGRDWSERAAGFRRLKSSPAAMAGSVVANSMMHLLRRENAVVVATLRDSHGQVAVAEKYGEEFGEYYSDLFSVCLRYCPKGPFLDLILENERSDVSEVRNDAVRMLGQLAAPGLGFGADQRHLINQRLVLACNDGTSFLVRENAVRSIAAVVQAGPLPTEEHRELHEAVANATADSYGDVRQAAVRALGDIGGPADLALLRQVAERDTARSGNPGRMLYPVRDEARRAIARINAR